jgi:hypothetical protein
VKFLFEDEIEKGFWFEGFWFEGLRVSGLRV